jgi:NADPH:quinone reductase-like Zn-dependent oxidoreductase
MAQRSWRKGEPLAWVEQPTPAPRAREVRVAVKAIGVNPVDWKMRSFGPLRLAARVVGPPPPVVVGVDFAGVVDAVGAHVRGVKPGERVVGGTDFSRRQRGSYGDTVFVREDQLCPLPPGFDLEVAGALPVAGVTAWMSLVEIGRLAAGQRALILGAAGGVGQFALQLAKHTLGAFAVAVCSGKNADLVRGLGADAVIDYTQGDALALARSHAPYQVVMDCVGSYSGAGCRALLARGGRHVVVSGDSPGAIAQLFVPPFSSKAVLARANRERLAHVVAAVAAGQVKVNIVRCFPLAEAEEAHRVSRSGRVAGKLILVP